MEKLNKEYKSIYSYHEVISEKEKFCHGEEFRHDIKNGYLIVDGDCIDRQLYDDGVYIYRLISEKEVCKLPKNFK